MFIQKSIEAAQFATMAVFHARDVVGYGAGFFRYGQHIGGRHVENSAAGSMNRAIGQGPGDAVDLGDVTG